MALPITGFDRRVAAANAGSQGEYAGLLAIRAYHASRNGDIDRNVCLIPSAHGTNPPAQMCRHGRGGDQVRRQRQRRCRPTCAPSCGEHWASKLAAFMITYPSTHGVFEEAMRAVRHRASARRVRSTWTAPT